MPRKQSIPTTANYGDRLLLYFRTGVRRYPKHKKPVCHGKIALSKLRDEIPNIRESEILFVGDSIERDMIPAKELGLNGSC